MVDVFTTFREIMTGAERNYLRIDETIYRSNFSSTIIDYQNVVLRYEGNSNEEDYFVLIHHTDSNTNMDEINGPNCCRANYFTRNGLTGTSQHCLTGVYQPSEEGQDQQRMWQDAALQCAAGFEPGRNEDNFTGLNADQYVYENGPSSNIRDIFTYLEALYNEVNSPVENETIADAGPHDAGTQNDADAVEEPPALPESSCACQAAGRQQENGWQQIINLFLF